jgi:simple sugar transport system permease protein
MSEERAENIGIDVNRTRVIALVISTVIAAIGQFVFVQDMGMINVYTGHLNTDIFSCAALLAGGATIKNAQVKNALLGIFLLHTLFILSPLAGQNVFHNVSLGEYFRSFVAYGTIAFALIMNLKYDSAK